MQREAQLPVPALDVLARYRASDTGTEAEDGVPVGSTGRGVVDLVGGQGVGEAGKPGREGRSAALLCLPRHPERAGDVTGEEALLGEPL
jgi:hypothetical protein